LVNSLVILTDLNEFKIIFLVIETETIKDFDRTEFLSYIMRVAQSNQEFLLNGELDLQISVTKRIEGRGNKKNYEPPQDNTEKRAQKQSIVKIKNNGKRRLLKIKENFD
jgi:hypothetical protein